MTTDTKALRALLDAWNAHDGTTDCSQDGEALAHALFGQKSELLDAADERDALRVEVARLRGDAMRYRWLRDVAPNFRFDAPLVFITNPRGFPGSVLEDVALDAAIDAVLEGPKK